MSLLWMLVCMSMFICGVQCLAAWHLFSLTAVDWTGCCLIRLQHNGRQCSKAFVQYDKKRERTRLLCCQDVCHVIVAYNVHLIAGGDCPRA